jgi:ADP-heptose:LPS heptosyltransferase
MNIIHLDNSPPLDDCPAIHYVPPIQRFGLRTKFKNELKAWIYRFISGRPKRNVSPIPENPRCVLVATGGNLGGAIISLPLIEGVRKRWPNAHLAVVSNRQNGLEIVKLSGVGDSFHLAPEVSLSRLLVSLSSWSFRNRIRHIAPEVFIGNHDFNLTHTLPLSSIALTIGHVGVSPFSSSLDITAIIYDMQVKSIAQRNWLESYWDILDSIGFNSRETPAINVTESQQQKLQGLFELRGGVNSDLIIGIQASVWAQQQFKAWPDSYMAEFCVMMWTEHKIQSLIIGAIGQESLGDYLRHHFPYVPFIDGVGKFSISELPVVIAECAAVVTNDSGLMHLSAAVGTPTLAIYGMTDPKVTWVYGDNGDHRIIRRAGCMPCYGKDNKLMDTCSSRHCLNHITPQTIFDELTKMLQHVGRLKKIQDY